MERNKEVFRRTWNHPLREVARTRKTTPEAWLGECLAEEIHNLTIVVRALEFQVGFDEGRKVGRVENVLATKLAEAEPGTAAVATN